MLWSYDLDIGNGMNFSDADCRVPDPANNRNTTLAMVASIRREGPSTIEGSTLSRFRSVASLRLYSLLLSPSPFFSTKVQANPWVPCDTCVKL